MRTPKPFYRAQTHSWYVKLGKRFIPLGRTEKEAWAAYHKVMCNGAPSDETVQGILNHYWVHCEENLKASTCDRRRSKLVSFGDWCGKMPVAKLVPHHVHQWIADKYPQASSTYKNTLQTIIKGAFQWAEDNGLCDNPIRKLKKSPVRVRQEFLPAVKWGDVLGAATDDCFRDYLIVSLLSGARPQEMFKMEARHFDGEHIIFPIDESKGEMEARVIFLAGEALEIVKRLAVKEGPLFLNSRGMPWTRNSIKCRFRRLKVILKEPKLCATVLRHSYCHDRLVSGQPDHIVAELMGHRSTRMVQMRYGHLSKATGFLKLEAAKHVKTIESRPPASDESGKPSPSPRTAPSRSA